MFSFFTQLHGRSPRWKAVRSDHIAKHPKCAICGRKEGLEVHHIIPFHINPDLELEPSNLITLCGKYCHFVFGHLMNWQSWNENIVEDSKDYHEKIKNRPYMDVFASNRRSLFYEIYNYITDVICKLLKCR
jgi:5-methylcytosine-specific restriction enzyme A